MTQLRYFFRAIGAIAVVACLGAGAASPATADPVVTDPATFAVELFANVTDPFHLAFDPNGNLFVGRDASGSGGSTSDAVKIHRVSPDGVSVVEFGDQAIADPDSVVVDTTGSIGSLGSILVGSITDGIDEIESGGSVISSVVPSGPLTNPQQIKFDSAKNLLVANCVDAFVAKVESGTKVVSILHDFFGPSCLAGLAVDPEDRVYVSDSSEGEVIRIDIPGVAHTTLVGGLSNPDGLAFDDTLRFDPMEPLFVAERDSGEITTIDPLNAGNSTVFATGLMRPFGLAFGPRGCLYVSDFDADEIWRFGFNDGAGGVLCPRDVAINVKPGSDPNSINTCSNGGTPITIWGSAALDVGLIDTSQLLFASAAVRTVGRGDKELCSIGDFGAPDEGLFDNLDPLPDGFLDLSCKFDTSMLALDDTSDSASISMTLCTDDGGDGICDPGDAGYDVISTSDSVNVVRDCN